jgi:hypothetical protein
MFLHQFSFLSEHRHQLVRSRREHSLPELPTRCGQTLEYYRVQSRISQGHYTDEAFPKHKNQTELFLQVSGELLALL